jgi:RNA polymerase sigma factor (sigma-70 family)
MSRFLLLQSDARVLELIRTGDEEAMVLLYRQNRKAITAYVTSNSGSKDDAEDMLQEALVVLWQRVRARRFDATARVSTFLYAVVRNLWLRKLAHRRREIPSEIEPEQVVDPASSFLDDMIEVEKHRRVRKALHKLGEPCRRLLLLYYWEEQTMEQIAHQMGFANSDTVKSKKYQCKKMLQQLLHDAGEEQR